MKKLIVLLIFVVSLMFCMAAQRAQVGSELATPNFPWVAGATWLAAGDEATALAVTERTFKIINTAIAADASGDGKITIYTLPYGTNAIRIRAIGLAPNESVVVDILSGTFDGNTDDCAMVLRGTLTFVIGLQKAVPADYEIADTVSLTAASDAASTSDWKIRSPGSGSETCASGFRCRNRSAFAHAPAERQNRSPRCLPRPYPVPTHLFSVIPAL